MRISLKGYGQRCAWEKCQDEERLLDCVLSRRLPLHELLDSRQQRHVGRKQVLGMELVSNRGSVRDGKATVWFLLKLSHSGEIFQSELSAVG